MLLCFSLYFSFLGPAWLCTEYWTSWAFHSCQSKTIYHLSRECEPSHPNNFAGIKEHLLIENRGQTEDESWWGRLLRHLLSALTLNIFLMGTYASSDALTQQCFASTCLVLCHLCALEATATSGQCCGKTTRHHGRESAQYSAWYKEEATKGGEALWDIISALRSLNNL